eukprot:CAMPEP_0194596774 /NCGR_PEP_ID=MMETSP0292-20121207/25882_1 /TAXON_ID=39354 /ORGANISM="Heterosigma akashiwo, Strain CCMP2393" /LENGTH=78 /DNA_ID=CAMNT_0039457145 /DNA_START=129 /DNA_END=361 /DNA_ORIENTATION=+
MWAILSPQMLASMLSSLSVISVFIAGKHLVHVLVRSGASLASLGEAKAINCTTWFVLGSYLLYVFGQVFAAQVTYVDG